MLLWSKFTTYLNTSWGQLGLSKPISQDSRTKPTLWNPEPLRRPRTDPARHVANRRWLQSQPRCFPSQFGLLPASLASLLAGGPLQTTCSSLRAREREAKQCPFAMPSENRLLTKKNSLALQLVCPLQDEGTVPSGHVAGDGTQGVEQGGLHASFQQK